MVLMSNTRDTLPPHCPEAERGVLGCCLLDVSKAAVAIKAGVNPRWFYDGRHAELFRVLARLAQDGGGDMLLATMLLRERFVVRWAWPLFQRTQGLDPNRLKSASGRPATHKPETLLD